MANRRARNGRSASGFTLVELLVVVVVVALLIGLLLPALGGARAAGRASVCLSRARDLGIANASYANDHGGRLCPHAVWNPSIRNSSGTLGANQEWCAAEPVRGDPTDAHRFGILGPYLAEGWESLSCPEYETPADVLETTREIGLAYPQLVHYGYNGLLLGEKHPNFNAVSPEEFGYRRWVGYRQSALERPARTAMFADSAQRLVGRLIPQRDILPPVDEWFEDGSPRAFSRPSAHGRHSSRASVAWADGHASHRTVTVYADQHEDDHRDRLGFLAPEGQTERRNDLMLAFE
jgi:prepilin-type N-terminal cleavage/methylation domain-containing protein/prepilin-type processing-associated H-X9-DG protein